MRISRNDLRMLLASAEARQRVLLGDAPASRLLTIPLKDILERAWILSVKPTAFFTPPRNEITLPATSKAALAEVEKNPTPTELGELGFLDAFFATSNPNLNVAPYYSDLQRIFCTSRTTIEGRIVVSDTVEQRTVLNPKTNPFFCPTRPKVYTNTPCLMVYSSSKGWPEGGYPGYFNLNPNGTWGSLLPAIVNIQTLFRVTGPNDYTPGFYKWPEPVKLTPGYWWSLNQKDLTALVKSPAVLTSDEVRLWITLSLVQQYNTILARAKTNLEQQAKSDKFNLIVFSIGMIAIGALLAVAVGAIVAGGFKLVSGSLTNAQKQDAARSLNEAATQLRTGDPGFAGEVQWAASYMQSLAEQQSKNQAAESAAQAAQTKQAENPLTALVGIGVPAAVSIGLSLLSK
jgi:hypothetical protein